ncbi:type III restriction enzyme [Tissierella praeacuta]|uniref:type III restriction-modification system endonuclease n=1 Tax=Tissierella praeacuta TaxID=43131 RepID=UPI0010503644|nr:DEAD/DEAH box helicase family protein [Tissierella praeacuta]TCU68935.1 type III restriction enzyme [Tissierella praeacuta]
MKIKFKEQQFQKDAVRSVIDCFKGQPREISNYTLDKGKIKKGDLDQTSFLDTDKGFKNKKILLRNVDVLDNIKKVQKNNGLIQSKKLEGEYNLTIEMETGTGKTYTYIRTMYELFNHYGWNKYIVVVPSIAIREGVYKSFQMTEQHFMDIYGHKIRYFIYNSRHLNKLETFASDSGINVMIINSQAFNVRGKDARRIYMELDEFNTRKPIDVIASANPILIIDEPQSVEGKTTKEALKAFNPLFTLRYSATHREEYNKIYRLDTLDAYNEKLVKKIRVKGIEVKGSRGTNEYIYLEEINLSKKGYPLAKIEYEVKGTNGIRKESRYVDIDFDLYSHSNYMEQYRGYRVSEINGYNNTIHFTNGITLRAGEVQGDISELNMRRIQIRETIKSHFEKERELFNQGIKVLSLFFIDEVAKYRQYDKDGNELNGIYATIFEEEYINILNEYINLFDDPYVKYLKSIDLKKTHDGYFSIDKNKRMIDPTVKGKEKESDDETAFDKIMKNKERLLSFEEPIRFIFSHSALREGWDNPNVFQICTLKHSDSTVGKRQEVGRGLRLCVNKYGERMDKEVLGEDVHEVNMLTVVASESYESFAKELQSDIAKSLSDRPRKADKDFFKNKIIKNKEGKEILIDEKLANNLQFTFIQNGYVDINYELTDKYFKDLEENKLIIPEELKEFEEGIIQLVGKIYVEGKTDLVEDARDQNVKDIKVNDNFNKKEFKELWDKINIKTAYYVDFDTEELIRNAIASLDKDLKVADLTYEVRIGEMEEISSKEELEKGEAFVVKEAEIDKLKANYHSSIKYDLIGKLVDETKLTRNAIVRILQGIRANTFYLFQKNPEEFIIKAAKLINEQKAHIIIEHIIYNKIDEVFDINIFTDNKLKGILGKDIIETKRHIYDYLKYDSSKEKEFAEEMDIRPEVIVYAKLPRGFYIPTPVGKYSPDWAIVFDEEKIKHIYFVAETKGKLESLEFDTRGVERAKILCAKKHFEKISNGEVKYHAVGSYEQLMEKIMKGN